MRVRRWKDPQITVRVRVSFRVRYAWCLLLRGEQGRRERALLYASYRAYQALPSLYVLADKGKLGCSWIRDRVFWPQWLQLLKTYLS